MELTHRFTVPTSVEETWTSFQDIASLAECFPGAQVTSVSSGPEGDTFQGTVKVKLGPIALVYAGSGTFVEKDENAHRLVVEAKGRDKRGNGTAGATATLTMTADGSGTAVEVVTDLSITGKPAQFGRGVMQDVSDKLLGQFVACLEQKSAAPEPAAPEPAAAAGAVAPDTAAAEGPTDVAAPPSPSGPTQSDSVGLDTPPPSGSGGSTSGAASSLVEPDSRGTSESVSRPTQSDSVGLDTPPPSGSGGSTNAGGSGGSTSGVGGSGGRSAAGSDDALDLGATVLPVLVKSYGKQAAAGLGVLTLLWLLVKALRRN